MYKAHTEIYDEVYHHLDYALAAETLLALIERVRPGAGSLLDIGCGTGRHLQLMQPHFRISGLDINPELLAIAHARLGDGARLYTSDMADFSLNDERFDVITCLFGSITFLVTPERLQRAVAAMARHLLPDGVLFIEPWLAPEQYRHNNVKLNLSETPARKIAWMYVGQEKANIVTNEIHFLIGEADGEIHYTEVQQHGLFSDADYRSAFADAGLVVVEHDLKGLFGYGLYIVRKAQ